MASDIGHRRLAVLTASHAWAPGAHRVMLDDLRSELARVIDRSTRSHRIEATWVERSVRVDWCHRLIRIALRVRAVCAIIRQLVESFVHALALEQSCTVHYQVNRTSAVLCKLTKDDVLCYAGEGVPFSKERCF